MTRSLDDGVTFGPFVAAATPVENPNGCLPNTNFRDGIIESFTASQTYPGHVYLTYEDWDAASGQFDVKFTPVHRRRPHVVARADGERCADSADDRSVPALRRGGSRRRGRGRVLRPPAAVPERPVRSCRSTWADEHLHRRLAPGLQGRRNGGGAVPVGGNVRVSQFTWDPRPAAAEGRRDHASTRAPAHNDPCPTGRGFIGDYFGLAISNGTSTRMRLDALPLATVTADGGGPVYYQQQVLGIVPRSTFGAGY